MTAEDRSGGIWAAGDLGLARYSVSDKRWTRYKHCGWPPGTAPSRQVAARCADGSVWIQLPRRPRYYPHEYLRWPGKGREHFTTANALRSDKATFLAVSIAGDGCGSARITAPTSSIGTHWRHFGRSEGLIWDDCNANAFFAAEDGAVWIGTSRGLSRFEQQPSIAAHYFAARWYVHLGDAQGNCAGSGRRGGRSTGGTVGPCRCGSRR